MPRPFLKPFLIHSCFSISLGEPRPAKCSCRKRLTQKQADDLLEQNLAERIVAEYRYDEDQKQIIPIHSWDLVWSQAAPEDADELVSSGYALKTPRVHTIEKADLHRAYLDGKQLDIDRIEEWGRMAKEVIESLIVPFIEDPFEGRAILPTIGLDQRTKF